MLEKYKEKFSNIFSQVLERDYYAVPKTRLSQISYEEISAAASNHVFLMKQWDETAERILDEGLTTNQRQYRRDGYLIKRNFIPHELIDRYIDLRHQLDIGPKGFGSPICYIEHPEIRDLALYPPLVELFRELHTTEMALLISHTSHRSTQRGWHQDSYLDNKAAIARLGVWIALDDIEPDSGPFEFIAGSHLWPPLCNQKINGFLKKQFHWPGGHNKVESGNHSWGAIAEAFINPAVERKIQQENLSTESFLPKKGDVLIWYGHLMHRGAKPTRPNAERPSIIGQYIPVNEKGRGLFVRCKKSGGYFLVRPSMYDALKFDQ